MRGIQLIKRMNESSPQDSFNQETLIRRKEISQYVVALAAYEIKMIDLPKLCPVKLDDRVQAMTAARVVAENNELRAVFMATKALPVNELVTQWSVSIDIVEKYPKYITALALLQDYPHLKSCLQL